MANTHLTKKVKREANYDLLRIVSTIAVIIIHVSATYKNAYTDPVNPYQTQIIVTLLYNTLSRFAVPCFMMISGAFLLANEKNKDYKSFYNKAFRSIGIPTMIFSLLYFLYNIAIILASIIFKGGSFALLLEPIKDVILGEPFYHMWYLYTLAGVYVFIPFLIKLKDDIGEKNFTYLSWVFLLISTCSTFTSTYQLHWGISKVICYVGYIFAGYQLRKIAKTKNNLKGVLLILAAFILLLGLTYIQYTRTIQGIPEADEKYTIIGNFNPIVVVSSLLIFAGFSYMKINTDKLNTLAKDTFIIYLFHAGIWRLGSYGLFYLMGGKTEPIITIPVAVVLVFILSWICTIIYNKIWSILDKENRVTNAICKMFRFN